MLARLLLPAAHPPLCGWAQRPASLADMPLVLGLLLLAIAIGWGSCCRCCCPSCCCARCRLLLPLLLPVMLVRHAVQVLQPAHPRGAVADLFCVDYILRKA